MCSAKSGHGWAKIPALHELSCMMASVAMTVLLFRDFIIPSLQFSGSTPTGFDLENLVWGEALMLSTMYGPHGIYCCIGKIN